MSKQSFLWPQTRGLHEPYTFTGMSLWRSSTTLLWIRGKPHLCTNQATIRLYVEVIYELLFVLATMISWQKCLIVCSISHKDTTLSSLSVIVQFIGQFRNDKLILCLEGGCNKTRIHIWVWNLIVGMSNLVMSFRC